MKKMIKTIWKDFRKHVSIILMVIVLFIALAVANWFFKGTKNDLSEQAIVRDIIKEEQEPIVNKEQIKEQKQAVEKDYYVDCSCEETFEEPIDVVWAGDIFAYMSGGEQLAIKRVPKDKEYPLFAACCINTVKENGKWLIPPEKWITGRVKIIGKWTGITCMYANTFFNSKCVPYVEIERIERTTKYTPVTHLNDLKWFTARIEEHNKYASIDIEYPQFIGGQEVEKLNEYIKGTVLNELNKDRNYVKGWMADKIEGCEDTDANTFNGRLWECSAILVSEYKVSSIINDVVSLELVLTDFTGGGNGNHDLPHIINWDLKNNRLLDKKEIFCDREYPNELTLAVYENMFDKYGKDYLLYILNDIDEKIQSFEFDVLLGYQGLSIVFRPYAILSGADGIVRVPISYSDLENKICF